MDKSSRTPLHVAAEQKSADVVEFLLERKSLLDSNQKRCNIPDITSEDAQRPIPHDAIDGDESIVASAVDANDGINKYTNARDKHMRTPLHHAAMSGSKEVIKLLLKWEVHKTLKDKDGLAAIDLAIRKGHQNVLDIFTKAEDPKVKDDKETLDRADD